MPVGLLGQVSGTLAHSRGSTDDIAMDNRLNGRCVGCRRGAGWGDRGARDSHHGVHIQPQARAPKGPRTPPRLDNTRLAVSYTSRFAVRTGSGGSLFGGGQTLWARLLTGGRTAASSGCCWTQDQGPARLRSVTLLT